MPVKNAETYLRTAAYQLRKSLSGHGFKDTIVSAREQYRIDLDEADIDFIQWEQEVAALAGIDSSTEAAAIGLEKRYEGELFEDQTFEWDLVERERLAILYDSFATRLAEWLLENRRYREALQIAKKVVSRNEFEEKASLLLLAIQSAMGDGQGSRKSDEHQTRGRARLTEDG